MRIATAMIVASMTAACGTVGRTSDPVFELEHVRADGEIDRWRVDVGDADDELTLCGASGCVDFGGDLESADEVLLDRATSAAFAMFEDRGDALASRADASGVFAVLKSKAARAVLRSFVTSAERALGVPVNRVRVRSVSVAVNELTEIVEWLRVRTRAAWLELGTTLSGPSNITAAQKERVLGQVQFAVQSGTHGTAAEVAAAIGLRANDLTADLWHAGVLGPRGALVGEVGITGEALEHAIQLGRLERRIGAARARLGAFAPDSGSSEELLAAIADLTDALKGLLEHELRPLWRAFG